MNVLFTLIADNGKAITGFGISDYITFAVLALVFGALAYGFVRSIIKDAKKRKKTLAELSKPVEEPPITEIDARVLKKECFVKTYGTKLPESRKEFYITFLTFSGETKRYPVEEELYLSVEENTVGTIALVNDNFFDFYFEI